MLKRGPIIVVGIIAVLLLVSPFAIGMLTENGMRERLEIHNLNPSFAATVESYDRGWFNSRVRLNYGLSQTYLSQIQGLATGLPPGMLGSFNIPVIVEVAHGPVLLSDGFGLGTAEVKAYIDPEAPMAQLAQQFLGMPYVFELRGRGGFGTGFRFEGEVPPIDNAFGDLSIAFAGFNFSGVTRNRDTVFEGSMENAALQSPYASGIIESLAATMDYDYRQDEVPLSNFQLSIGRITAIDPSMGAAPAFSAEDMAMSGTMRENDAGEQLDMQVLYSLADLTIADAFAISDAAIGIGLNNMDPDATKQLYELSDQLSGVTDPDQILAMLMPVLEQLMTSGAVLSLDPLKFTMPQGNFDARMSLSIDPAALPPGILSNPQNLPLALDALAAQLDLTVSKGMADYLGGLFMGQQLAGLTGPNGEPLPPEQLQAMARAQVGGMLAQLAAQGMVVDNGDSYSTSIQFADGQAVANGQLIPIGF